MAQRKQIGFAIITFIASSIRPAVADRWTTLLPLENVNCIQIQHDSLGQTYYWFGTDNNDLFRYDVAWHQRGVLGWQRSDKRLLRQRLVYGDDSSRGQTATKMVKVVKKWPAK